MGENASRRVFISYSHKDEDWTDRLVTHRKALEHQILEIAERDTLERD